MTIIANPIYDTVFKFLMEDNRVAKILLSALLQKEVVEVQMRQTEYTDSNRSPISMFRLDFAAKIREKDGKEHTVLIELQKTWRLSETLRFRQYLGTQYLDKENIPVTKENSKRFALPMISIYILGHKLGDLQEPVVYVRRRYLDQDSNPIVRGVPDPFIESLTHDTIIVQIPYLQGRTRNRLERLLNMFDQAYTIKGNEHFLQIDEDKMEDNDERLVVYRLVKAAAAPDIRRAMDVEDEILSEIESRDTTIMQKDQIIQQKNQTIQEKDQAIQEKDQTIQKKEQAIQEKEQTIQEKEQAIQEKEQAIQEKDQAIQKKEQAIQEKDQTIQQKDQMLQQKDKIIHSMISLLASTGHSIAAIAAQFSLTEEEVKQLMEKAD